MDILFQDRRIVVAVKPSGVLSTDEPGGMPALLRQELHTECIRTVHRLDAPVSGLMVFARSAYAAGDLSRQIRDGTFEKHYLAVLRGAPPEREGTLTDLLARDKDARCHHKGKGRSGGPPALPGAGQPRRSHAGSGAAAHRADAPDPRAVFLPRPATGGRPALRSGGRPRVPHRPVVVSSVLLPPGVRRAHDLRPASARHSTVGYVRFS